MARIQIRSNYRKVRTSFSIAREYAYKFLERPKIGGLMQRLAAISHDQLISPVLVARLVSSEKDWEGAIYATLRESLIVQSGRQFSNLSLAFNSLERGEEVVVAQSAAMLVLTKSMLLPTQISIRDSVARLAATTRISMILAERSGEPPLRIAPACLFHDIGYLVLAASDGEFYTKMAEMGLPQKSTMLELEQAHFGTDHCEVGGLILMALQFTDYTIAACQEHHNNGIRTSWISQVVRTSESLVDQLKVQSPNEISIANVPEHESKFEIDEDLIIRASKIIEECSNASRKIFLGSVA